MNGVVLTATESLAAVGEIATDVMVARCPPRRRISLPFAVSQ
jgi:hypothetical protein